MASSVDHLQHQLDRIANLAKQEFYGATDRRRTLLQIREIAANAILPPVEQLKQEEAATVCEFKCDLNIGPCPCFPRV